MKNKPQKRGHDHIETSFDPKTGKINTNASGPNAAQNHKKAFWRSVLGGIAIMAVGASLGILLYRDKEEADTKSTITKDNNKTDNKIRKNHEAAKDAINVDTAKTQNDIELHRNKIIDDIKFDSAHTDNQIRLEEARSARDHRKTEEVEIRSKLKLCEMRKQSKEMCKRKEKLASVTVPKLNKGTFNTTHPYAINMKGDFYSWFIKELGNLPILPPILHKLIAGCWSSGFNIPALFICLSVLGAYCFSSLRAHFHGSTQSPSIFVVVEGASGSGKGAFNRLYQKLAERFIKHDNEHLIPQKKSITHRILQTTTVKITRAKYAERQHNNQDVFTFMFCAEIDSAKNLFRNNGLGDDFLRLDFDNDLFEYDNCRKDAYHGYRPIYNNFVFTGTPQTVENFIKGKVENGDASRIIWTDIPIAGFDNCTYNGPSDSVLAQILDNLDIYHKKYTFFIDTEGNEVPCPETIVDLSFVQSALEKWGKEQQEKYKKDNQQARPDQYKRISTIAFRCAMVLHALWSFPKDEETQQKVVDLTLYLADYIMERYIYKFGHIHNIQSQFASQKVSERGAFKEVPDNVIADWVRRNNVLGEDGKPKEGYGTFAKEWNDSHPNNPISKDTVKRRMNRYTKSHPEK